MGREVDPSEAVSTAVDEDLEGGTVRCGTKKITRGNYNPTKLFAESDIILEEGISRPKESTAKRLIINAGEYYGHLKVDQLIVKAGLFSGTAIVENNVVIHPGGAVIGRIACKGSVEIMAGGSFSGDIGAQEIKVDPKASFDGKKVKTPKLIAMLPESFEGSLSIVPKGVPLRVLDGGKAEEVGTSEEVNHSAS